MTPAMLRAMGILEARGTVFAGCQTEGDGQPINASTLRALERRGLVRLGLSPDGGMMARLALSEERCHNCNGKKTVNGSGCPACEGEGTHEAVERLAGHVALTASTIIDEITITAPGDPSVGIFFNPIHLGPIHFDLGIFDPDETPAIVFDLVQRLVDLGEVLTGEDCAVRLFDTEGRQLRLPKKDAATGEVTFT